MALLPLTIWFLAMHLLTQAKNNVSALELKRHLGVRYKTAWLLKHKLMQVMSEREAPRQLDGRVEIDDAYLGGELPGGKSGRGSENKVSATPRLLSGQEIGPANELSSRRPREVVLDRLLPPMTWASRASTRARASQPCSRIQSASSPPRPTASSW